ncbi:MAG TPA: hypothetical protein V6D10_01655 [Trichocoleus sp.]
MCLSQWAILNLTLTRLGCTPQAGAASWCTVSAETAIAPATAWQTLADLPLVALSIPRVVLDPNRSGNNLPSDEGTKLPLNIALIYPTATKLMRLPNCPKFRVIRSKFRHFQTIHSRNHPNP